MKIGACGLTKCGRAGSEWALAASVIAGFAFPAAAQIAPVRTYNGVGRPVMMRLSLPSGMAPGSAAVELWDPKSARMVASARIEQSGSGDIDLASIVPDFWSEAAKGVSYARVKAGDRELGPAITLQPMVTPMYAPRADRSGSPMFSTGKEREVTFSGVRAYVDQDVEFTTTMGTFRVRLLPEVAPNTCWNFRQLVDGGMYTDVIVHGVVSLAGRREPDIVQTGDPTGTGRGGPGYSIDLEPSTLPHDFGVVSSARFSDVNSGGSQFMICLNREGTAYMDGRYTAFGVVLDWAAPDGGKDGGEVIRAIAATPVGPDNRPKDPPVIRSARLVDAVGRVPVAEGQETAGTRPATDPLKRERER